MIELHGYGQEKKCKQTWCFHQNERRQNSHKKYENLKIKYYDENQETYIHSF